MQREPTISCPVHADNRSCSGGSTGRGLCGWWRQSSHQCVVQSIADALDRIEQSARWDRLDRR